MQVQWSHCVLKVRDIEAMTNFYCDALGFQVADRGKVGPDTEIVFLSGASTDHHQMGLMTGRGAEDTSSLDHNAFRVGSIDDVKQMVDWVAADERIGDGFPVTHGNAVSVYFSDPEGNGIEIFSDTPWHVQQPVIQGWDPSKSADDVLAAVEARFKDNAEFMEMDRYRAERAQHFGEQHEA